ncbi:MAG: hypothetical protein ABIK73_06905 [candidate division WOR-3 bacterium]
MCHNVNGLNTINYYYLYDEKVEYFYGLKRMRVDDVPSRNGTLWAEFMAHKYDCEFGADAIVVRDVPKTQPIEFAISVSSLTQRLHSTYVCKREVKAGMHIHPFFYYNKETGRFILYCEPDEAYIVIFRSEDILFYDGKDISVASFIIPSDKEITGNTLLFEYLGENGVNIYAARHKQLFDALRKGRYGKT